MSAQSAKAAEVKSVLLCIFRVSKCFKMTMKEWAQWALVNECDGEIGERVEDVKVRSGVAEHL